MPFPGAGSSYTAPGSPASGTVSSSEGTVAPGAGSPWGRRGRRSDVHLCRFTDDGAVIVGRGELTWPNGDPVRQYLRQ
ncbi:hypothetical protein [Streptomyces sp. NBC_00454]|uniref:hypothetical protein n=1 Tax=Streptomyces sp. NBC_00454 TaxID=2975747 RepID=UPI003245F219